MPKTIRFHEVGGPEELADAVGAIPIATTRNQAKEKSLRDAGAKFVVNTRTKDWITKVRDISSGKGVDLAFDPVAGPELERVAQAMRPEGTIFLYGALAPEPTPLPLFAAIFNNLTLRGYSLFSIVANPDRLARAKSWVYDRLAAGKLKPIIARTFSLEEIVEAHRFMESYEQIGKIVVTVAKR